MQRIGERGQASPEWLGLVLLVALALAGAAAGGLPVPGAGLARAVAARIVCAAGFADRCGERGALALAYGPELAALVAEHAPSLDYEEGMRAVPVDFRSCRADACAEGAETGPVRESLTGEPVTAFVHVIDCRDDTAAQRQGYDCLGARTGRVYVQYWLYYPGSATARAVLGDRGYHRDDWESFQVRIASGQVVVARASSHNGYNGSSGDWLSDSGLVEKPGWAESSGRYFISGGSHAGRIGGGRVVRRTGAAAIRLVPIESLTGLGRFAFAVSPPWAKRVYRDPEYRGTD